MLCIKNGKGGSSLRKKYDGLLEAYEGTEKIQAIKESFAVNQA